MNDKTTKPVTDAAALPMGFAIEREENFIPAPGGKGAWAAEGIRGPISVTWLHFRWLDRTGKVCQVSIQTVEDADWAALDLERMGRRIREMVKERGRLGG